MDTPAVHPFFDLELTDRARWIAGYCDRALSPSLIFPILPFAFPLLPRGESPLTWLEDQFRRAGAVTAKAGRLREAVVDLLRRELDGIDVNDHLQVLGTLVDLARVCSFTEVGPKLRDWIRGDHFASAFYEVDGHPISLRQVLWSAIIAWGVSEEMRPYLKRDLGRAELECGELCFLALGRLSPFDAITEIPTTCTWPLPYRDEVLRSFFEGFSHAARTLVEPDLLPAWQRCFAELWWNPEISELFQPYMDSFRNLLSDVGLDICKRPGEEKFDLRPKERAFAGLLIDLEPIKRQVDERILTYYEGLLVGSTMNFAGWAAPAYGTRHEAGY
jgi:hypothetical protein